MVEECKHCNALSGLTDQCVGAPQCKGAFTSRMLSASLLAGSLDQQAQTAICGVVQGQLRLQRYGCGSKESHHSKWGVYTE